MAADRAAAIAEEVLGALDARGLIEPLTSRAVGLDTASAYAVTAALRSKRLARGETPVGRKIGFTNRNIWPEYGVFEPIWGDVYDTTVRDVKPGDTVAISHLPQPRIEPEIVLGLDADLIGDMTADEIAACIGWIAHGFEIVQSIYPDWRFAVADCVANGGLHGALFIGRRRALSASERLELVSALPRLTIELDRDGEHLDTGVGANVLDGPIQALRHLVDQLGRDHDNPPLRAGEFVTTGTITRAFPASPGQRWTTRVGGYDLPGMDLIFE